MRRLTSALWSNRKARLGLVLVGMLLLCTFLGPVLTVDADAFLGIPLSAPSIGHLFGTNGQGQDVLAQTLVGGQRTLTVAFITGALTVVVGALVGGIGGYLGGWVDDAVTLLINVFLLLPGLPLMVVLAAWLPPGPVTMTAVLVVTGWAWHARVLRSQVATLAGRDWVAAAVVSGESDLRILVVEILPNMASLMGSSFIGATVYAVGAQVGLEFLGLGDPSVVTWGTNLYWAANDAALLTGSWWTFVPTGAAIAMVGFGLTLVSFGIDEITNPRLATSDGAPQPTPVVFHG